jgi:hypothetical protein
MDPFSEQFRTMLRQAEVAVRAPKSDHARRLLLAQLKPGVDPDALSHQRCVEPLKAYVAAFQVLVETLSKWSGGSEDSLLTAKAFADYGMARLELHEAIGAAMLLSAIGAPH